MTIKNTIQELLTDTYGSVIRSRLDNGETEFVHHAEYLDHPFLLVVQLDQTETILILSILLSQEETEQISTLTDETLQFIKEAYSTYFVDFIDNSLVITDALNFLTVSFSDELIEERLSTLESVAYKLTEQLYS